MEYGNCCAGINIETIKSNYCGLLGKRVVLKFKASREMGFGHLSRMITLADFLMEKNVEVVCAVNNFEYVKKRLIAEGLDFVVNEFGVEEEFVDDLIEKFSPDTLVVDERYEYKSEDIKRWKKKVRFVSFDFVGKGYRLCDKIVIPNAHFQPERYAGYDNIVWGWDWVLVSKDVLGLRPKAHLPRKINTVVVTTGGSDPRGRLFCVIDMLKECKKQVLILIGDSFKYRDRLRELNLPENFIVEPYLPDKLLAGDVAIATLGLSVYELIYLNIPIFCMGHAESDERGCEVLAKRCCLVKRLKDLKEVFEGNLMGGSWRI